MIKKIKKFLKNQKNSDLQKKAKIERKRLYMEPTSSESTFKKRKKIQIEFPLWMRDKSIKAHLKILYLVCIALLLGGTLFVVYGPFFKVKTIEIIRKDDITDINIAYKSLEDYRDKLIFGINSQEIAEQLKIYQKNISDVTIKKVFPNTLNITVGSYKGVFSTVINEKNYIITSNGVLVPGNGGSDVQIMKFTSPYANMNGIIDYKQVFSAKYIGEIVEVLNRIKYNLLSYQIKSLYYFPKEREIHIDIENTKLILDLDGDIEEQIRKIVIFSKQTQDLKKPGILYIDLRVKNKIFFCTLETEFDCRRNLNYFYQYNK